MVLHKSRTFASEIKNHLKLPPRGRIRVAHAGFMNNSKKNELKNIMNEAWRIVRTTGRTIAQALKCAWANAKLYKKMLEGVVRFEYIKLSTGEHRTAYGTLKGGLVPTTTGARRRYDHLQTYYDTVKQGWRSFAKSELVSVG